MTHKTKIVITGGPSAGKTTIAETISREYTDQITIVPEAASLLFHGGFPRIEDPEAVRSLQRAIYFVQRELEETIVSHSKHKFIVCDRGSLDGLAYWPGQKSGFLRSIESTLEWEMDRYDWVLHLNTADDSHYDKSNPVRTETHKEAIRVNEKIVTAWEGHPRHLIIPNSDLFFHKIELTIHVIKWIMEGREFNEIEDLIKSALEAWK
ncbi:MAG: ATP-binding protein [Bdellovibrionales bacterium]|nr:ATP-binding protein [Bdellovibrionales bacterium]